MDNKQVWILRQAMLISYFVLRTFASKFDDPVKPWAEKYLHSVPTFLFKQLAPISLSQKLHCKSPRGSIQMQTMFSFAKRQMAGLFPSVKKHIKGNTLFWGPFLEVPWFASSRGLVLLYPQRPVPRWEHLYPAMDAFCPNPPLWSIMSLKHHVSSSPFCLGLVLFYNQMAQLIWKN